jgi:hypothetical protein
MPPIPPERHHQGCDGTTADLDQAVEKIRLYLRCLELGENAEISRLLAQTVQSAERRLQAAERADPAAIMLDELHRLLPAGAASAERAAADRPATVPVPTPPPRPRRMAEQRLDYWAPMRALRDLVVGLVELIFPRSRRYGQ